MMGFINAELGEIIFKYVGAKPRRENVLALQEQLNQRIREYFISGMIPQPYAFKVVITGINVREIRFTGEVQKGGYHFYYEEAQ